MKRFHSYIAALLWLLCEIEGFSAEQKHTPRKNQPNRAVKPAKEQKKQTTPNPTSTPSVKKVPQNRRLRLKPVHRHHKTKKVKQISNKMQILQRMRMKKMQIKRQSPVIRHRHHHRR